jgi:putative transposase
MPSKNEPPFVDRAYIELAKRHRYDDVGIAIILQVARLLGLSFGMHLAQIRRNADRVMARESLIDELSFQIALERKKNEILQARLSKIAPKSRPRYAPTSRFDIVELIKLAVLTIEEASREFVVSTSAIYRWMREAKLNPEAKAIGRLLQITPPIRRIADDIRYVVQLMRRSGIRGSGMVARMLVREGFRISPTSVRRICKETRIPEPKPPAPDPQTVRVVTARCPNHVWMADITIVPSLFRILSFHVGIVLDVFSRMPLATRVFPKEPTAEEMIELVRSAIDKHGRPRHFVSDQGPQFTSGELKGFLKSIGIRQRFGAIGKYGSIAIVERAIRTIKEILCLRWFRPLTIRDLEHRLGTALVYYSYLRPHMSLDGAIPAEIYFGVRPAHLDSHGPPRGLPRATEVDPPFDVAYLDEERTMPFLVPKAA